MKKISEKTILADILQDEKMTKILLEHNLPCLSCPFAQYEMNKLKLREVCEKYGIKVEDVLEELNKVYKKKK